MIIDPKSTRGRFIRCSAGERLGPVDQLGAKAERASDAAADPRFVAERQTSGRQMARGSPSAKRASSTSRLF